MNTSKNSSSKNNQLNRYWCHTCGFFHTDSEQDYLICNYCNQYKPRLLLRTVYFNYGLSKQEVSQCQDCQKEEMNSFNVTTQVTPVTRFGRKVDLR
jgi:DNA-directed RNA polymerase subunit RPC12/RpoP